MAIKDDRIFDKFARFEGDKYWTSYDPLSEKPPVKKPAGPPKVIDTLTMDYKEGGGDAAALRRGSAARTAATTGGTTAGGSGTIVEGGGTTTTDPERTVGEGEDDLARACEADGGRWIDSKCKKPGTCDEGFHWDWDVGGGSCVADTDDGDTVPPDEEESPDTGIEYEKADPYKYKDPEVKVEKGISETKRAEARRDRGTPFAESIRESMMGEYINPEGVTLGDRKYTLEDMDRKRAFNDAMLASAQKYASTGMSFSTPFLHAEEDMVRDLARKRLEGADEAARMDIELEMQRWEAAEPIMKLAAMSKLGMPAMPSGIDEPGEFKPGHYKISDVMEVPGFGLKIPGFSGLPITKVGAGKAETETTHPGGPQIPEGKTGSDLYKDPNDEFECSYADREWIDGQWVCPGWTRT
tara:strand:+ start:699 stop:1931 length:1233 start_codon:yes stop_codon:yes gene_type:complete